MMHLSVVCVALLLFTCSGWCFTPVAALRAAGLQWMSAAKCFNEIWPRVFSYQGPRGFPIDFFTSQDVQGQTDFRDTLILTLYLCSSIIFEGNHRAPDALVLFPFPDDEIRLLNDDDSSFPLPTNLRSGLEKWKNGGGVEQQLVTDASSHCITRWRHDYSWEFTSFCII